MVERGSGNGGDGGDAGGGGRLKVAFGVWWREKQSSRTNKLSTNG